jgi:hypothetical protein
MRSTTSASNLYRRVLCPGSHHAEANAPESKERPYSLTGTLLHQKDAMGEEGDTIPQNEILKRNVALREKFLWATLPRLCIPMSVSPMEIKETDGPVEYFIFDEDGNPIIPGHPDLVLWYPKHGVLIVFDSKFGRKMVPHAENNWQLKHYTVALRDPQYGEFADVPLSYAVITQALAPIPLHAAEYRKNEILPAKKEILDVWFDIQSPDAPRTASMEACWGCKALASCHEGQKLMTHLAKLKISEVPIPKLEEMAPTVELCQTAAEAFWDRLEYIAEKFPHLLNKFELGPGRPRRVIENPIAAHQRLVQSGLMSSEQFCECCKASATALDEMVAANFKCTLNEAKTKVAEALGEIMQVKEGKPVLREKNQNLITDK